MTTRSQKRKAVAELVPGNFEASIAENTPSENLIAGSSKVARVEPENLEEIKTSLRKEIMSDLTKILAENQKGMLKLIAPLNKKQPVCSNIQDSDSEPENISVARTSTPVKAPSATSSKTTPNNSRNRSSRSSVFLKVVFLRNFRSWMTEKMLSVQFVFILCYSIFILKKRAFRIESHRINPRKNNLKMLSRILHIPDTLKNLNMILTKSAKIMYHFARFCQEVQEKAFFLLGISIFEKKYSRKVTILKKNQK